MPLRPRATDFVALHVYPVHSRISIILAPGLTTGGRPVPHEDDRLALLAPALPTYWIDVLTPVCYTDPLGGVDPPDFR